MMDRVQDLDWWIHGQTGISSRAIWCVMNGQEPERESFRGRCPGNYPHDPDDFSRCYLLLQRNPAWRLQLDKMRPLCREWDALIDHWDELEQMFLAIFGGSFTDDDYCFRKRYDKEASGRMYSRMLEIEDSARKRPKGA